MKKIILVAGATGNLGLRIVKALIQQNMDVRVVVRKDSDLQKVKTLDQLGAHIFSVDNWNKAELTQACEGISCVVSSLAGLREVVVDAQKILLDAAIAANVPRFIPSDYSLDFTPFKAGENRNLDWRREFHAYLDNCPIKATSIFNGAFADMLTGQMPLILFKQKKILCWGNPLHTMDFTTMDNTATYTAHVAIDDDAPRYLRIAGDRKSPKDFQVLMSKLTHSQFKLFRPGGQKLLGLIIKITRLMAPGKNELYPAWQGMQYMHNMIDQRAIHTQMDNNRYKNIEWVDAEKLLTEHLRTTV